MRSVTRLFSLYVLGASIVLVGADLGLLQPWVPSFVAGSGLDKVGHLCFVGLLTILFNCFLSYRFVKIGDRKFLVGTVIIVVLVSIEEFSQNYLPTRSFESLDLVANYCGIVFAECFLRYRQPKTSIIVIRLQR